MLDKTILLQTNGYKPVNGEVLDVDKHMLPSSNLGVTTLDAKGNKIIVPYDSCYATLWERNPFQRIIGEQSDGEGSSIAAGLEDFIKISSQLHPGDEPHKIKYLDIQQPRSITSHEALEILSGVYGIPGKKPGDGGYPNAAGVLPENSHINELKLYETGFGRDGLFAVLMLDDMYPELTENVVKWLIQKQGLVYNPDREEEPGKILHEHREPDDPVGKKLTEQVGWGFSYYGAVDSSALQIQAIKKVRDRKNATGIEFLNEVIQIPERNGIPAHTRTVDTSTRMAIDWIGEKVSESKNGLFENKRIHPNGIQNQTWIDSHDSLFHSDGTILQGDSNRAHFEANVYAYDAFLDASEMYTERDPNFAESLRIRAADLRKQILKHFWVEDKVRGSYFAPAIEIIKSDNEDEPDELIPLQIRRSNMGHALNSRLLEGDDEETISKREATVRALFAQDMWCARGIRTLSSDEKRFGETRYHNGNVWPWDNVWIGIGLIKQGYFYAGRKVLQTSVENIKELGMFTEHIKGSNSPIPELNDRFVEVFNVIDQRGNIIEQPGQEVQLFTAAAIRRAEAMLPQLQVLFLPTQVEKELGFTSN